MIPPSGSGRSAPLPAMSVALRKDPRTPHIPGVARASGSMRRGATASRGRYESAPPWARRHPWGAAENGKLGRHVKPKARLGGFSSLSRQNRQDDPGTFGQFRVCMKPIGPALSTPLSHHCFRALG